MEPKEGKKVDFFVGRGKEKMGFHTEKRVLSQSCCNNYQYFVFHKGELQTKVHC